MDFEVSIMANGKTQHFIVRKGRRKQLAQILHDAKRFDAVLKFKAENVTVFFPAGTVENYWLREIK